MFYRLKYLSINVVVIVQYGTSLMNNLVNSDEFINAINKEKDNIKKWSL